MDLTIIYLTHNELDPKIADLCIKYLIKAANGKPIISVSQVPMDLGKNVCVGKLGKSGLNIDIQMKAGLEAAETKFIAVAEHDCIYHPEHFDFVPPDDEHFYYNMNCWLLQYYNFTHPEWNGVFSYFPDRAIQSQLICGREAMLTATNKKIAILSDPGVREQWPVHTRIGEPGTDAMNNDWLKRTKRIFRNVKLYSKWREVKDYIISCNARKFSTVMPTIDIRHGDNFTGGRRGKNRTYSLEPWGTVEDIFNGPK